MGVAQVHVHVPEQVLVHVVAKGVRIVRVQADVFVEVESAAERKIQALFAMHPHQQTVNRLHRASGRQTQDQMRVGPQFLCDDACHQSRGGVCVRSNNHFHVAELTTNGRSAASLPMNRAVVGPVAAENSAVARGRIGATLTPDLWTSGSCEMSLRRWDWKSIGGIDRKSTRLNSSHTVISYAVFCLKK